MMLALVAALTLLPLGASADTPVRTGTTEVVPHPDQGKLEAPVEPSHLPPGDAPIVSGDAPKLPPLPQGFNTHEGGWIKISYFASLRERVQPLITQADDARAELTSRLGYPVLDNVTVYIARTPGEMATLAPEGAPFPKYAAGVAYPQLGLVLLTIQSLHPNSRHDLVEIFRHELAHLSLYRAVRGRSVPRWFNEGFAVFASGETSFARLQTLWTATLSDELMPLQKMERTFPADDVGASVAYAQAADVVRYLVRQQDQHRFRAMIERIRGGQTFESAMRDAYGVDLATLEFEWREDVARRYTFWPVFFSGSLVWIGAIGLFVWGWRRRRKRSKETLERWAKEEEAEDKRRREVEPAPPRVHIVFARGTQRLPDMKPPPPMDAEVPKVEHDGRWHTLH
jgi:hypothetical protein